MPLSPTRPIFTRMSLLTTHFPVGGRASTRLKRPLSSTVDQTGSTSSPPAVPASTAPKPSPRKKAKPKAAKVSLDSPPSEDKIKIPAFAVEPPLPGPTTSSASSTAATVIPAQLTWDLSAAKQHLIQHDPRFEEMFGKWTPDVYADPKEVDAFRSESAKRRPGSSGDKRGDLTLCVAVFLLSARSYTFGTADQLESSQVSALTSGKHP